MISSIKLPDQSFEIGNSMKIHNENAKFLFKRIQKTQLANLFTDMG